MEGDSLTSNLRFQVFISFLLVSNHCIHEPIDLHIGQSLVALELVDHHMERVDDGVAGNEDPAIGLLLLQVLLAQGRRREVVGGDSPRDLHGIPF